MELYRSGRRTAIFWRAQAVAGDAGAAGRAYGYRLHPHRLHLSLHFCVAALRSYMGLVWDGHGSGVYSAAGADDRGAGSGGSAAGADLVFPGLELCDLGERLRVSISAHAGRAGRVLCGGFAVLSQRFAVNGAGGRTGVWSSGTGAPDECGTGAGNRDISGSESEEVFLLDIPFDRTRRRLASLSVGLDRPAKLAPPVPPPLLWTQSLCFVE